MHEERFRSHPASRVLDPEAPGMAALLKGVRAGHAIRASQRSSRLIETIAGKTPWLDCESSGSTGQPRCIRRTPASWIASFEISRARFAAGPQDHYAVLGSIGHSLGLYAVLEALHVGARLSVLSQRSPQTQWQTMAARSVSLLYATPTQLALLTQLTVPSERHCLPTVRCVLVGGGTVHERHRHWLTRLFPQAEIVQFYGTSETSFVTLTDADTPAASVGRAYPGVELRVQKVGPQDAAGELLVRSPYLAHAIVGAVSEPIGRPDGFVATGEVGFLDADDCLFLKGRLDRMITVADVNVFPEAIESSLLALEEVSACAVVARDDPARGQCTVCFIQSGERRLEAAAVRAHCRQTLGAHHVPRQIHYLDTLPLLPSGKPDLQSLTALARAYS